MEFSFSYTYPYSKAAVIHGMLMLRLKNEEPDFSFQQVKEGNGKLTYKIFHKVHPLLQPMLGSEIVVFEELNLYKTETSIEIINQSRIPRIGKFTPSITSTALVKETNGHCTMTATLVANVSQYKMPSFMVSRVKATMKKRFLELRKREEQYMA